MGISQLHLFMIENGIYEKHQLCDTRVVIDGCSPLFELFYKTDADFRCGGDYDKYLDDVIKYFEMMFSTFKKCNIEPIIVFDGGHDFSDDPKIELNRLIKKQAIRFSKIAKVLLETKYSYRITNNHLKITSINLHEFFKNIISLYFPTIKQVQCDYGGDKLVAALAKRYECPVISVDSDFFIYDLTEGFINYSQIDFDVISDNGKCYLNCDLYKVDLFLKKFNLKERSILPLFAVLACNNYTCFNDFLKFNEKNNIVIDKSLSYKQNAFRKFEYLLRWLGGLTKDEINFTAANFAAKLSLDAENRYLTGKTVDYSLKNYDLKDTDCDHIENILSLTSSGEEESILRSTRLSYPCGQSMPNEFIVDYHKGHISSTLLDVINGHKIILQAQMEDFSQSSSYSCSRYIRQVMYSILLTHDSNSEDHKQKCLSKIFKRNENGRYEVTRTKFKHVKEYDRDKNIQVVEELEVISNLDNGFPVPSLSEMYHVNKENRRKFLACVLKVESNFFEAIPNHLQLLFACIKFWISISAPDKKFVIALLMSIVYFESKKDAMSTDASQFNGTEKLGSCVAPSDSESPFDITIAHYYSQLQTCVQACVIFNLIMKLPFEFPALESLSGTLLYNLTLELQSYQNEQQAVEIFLGNETKLKKMYYKYKRYFVLD